VKYNMEDLRLDLMDVENRAEWRRRTRVADPHPRDLIQPEGEREIHSVHPNKRALYTTLLRRNRQLKENIKSFVRIFLVSIGTKAHYKFRKK